MDVDEDVDYGHDDELRPDEELEDVVSLGSGADDEEDLAAYRAHLSPTELTIPPSSIPASQQTTQDSHVSSGTVSHVALPSSIERVSSIATSTDSITGSQDATPSTRLFVDSAQPTQLTHELPSKPNFAPKFDKQRDIDRDRSSNRSSGSDLRSEYKRGGGVLTEDDRHYTGTAARRGRDRSPRPGSDRAPRSSETLGNDRVSASDSHRRAPSERSTRPLQNDRIENIGSERKGLVSEESADRRFLPNPAYRGRSASPPREKPSGGPASTRVRDIWRATQGAERESRDSRSYPTRDVTDRLADTWRPNDSRPPRAEQERTATEYPRTAQTTRPERRNEDKPPAQDWQRPAQRQPPSPPRLNPRNDGPGSATSAPRARAESQNGAVHDHARYSDRAPPARWPDSDGQTSGPPSRRPDAWGRDPDRSGPGLHSSSGRGYLGNGLIRPREEPYLQDPAPKRPRMVNGPPSRYPDIGESRSVPGHGHARARSASLGSDPTRRRPDYATSIPYQDDRRQPRISPPPPHRREYTCDTAPSRDDAWPGPPQQSRINQDVPRRRQAYEVPSSSQPQLAPYPDYHPQRESHGSGDPPVSHGPRPPRSNGLAPRTHSPPDPGRGRMRGFPDDDAYARESAPVSASLPPRHYPEEPVQSTPYRPETSRPLHAQRSPPIPVPGYGSAHPPLQRHQSHSPVTHRNAPPSDREYLNHRPPHDRSLSYQDNRHIDHAPNMRQLSLHDEKDPRGALQAAYDQPTRNSYEQLARYDRPPGPPPPAASRLQWNEPLLEWDNGSRSRGKLNSGYPSAFDVEPRSYDRPESRVPPSFSPPSRNGHAHPPRPTLAERIEISTAPSPNSVPTHQAPALPPFPPPRSNANAVNSPPSGFNDRNSSFTPTIAPAPAPVVIPQSETARVGAAMQQNIFYSAVSDEVAPSPAPVTQPTSPSFDVRRAKISSFEPGPGAQTQGTPKTHANGRQATQSRSRWDRDPAEDQSGPKNATLSLAARLGPAASERPTLMQRFGVDDHKSHTTNGGGAMVYPDGGVNGNGSYKAEGYAGGEEGFAFVGSGRGRGRGSFRSHRGRGRYRGNGGGGNSYGDGA